MKNIKKSKIFWTNVLASAVALLGLLTPDLLSTFGCTDNTKFLAIVGLITTSLNIFLRTFFNNPIVVDTQKIGGRPPREKKPNSLSPNGAFMFIGNDFTDTDEVYYSLAPGENEYPINIGNIVNFPASQHVLFVEPIEFTNIEDLTFYIY